MPRHHEARRRDRRRLSVTKTNTASVEGVITFIPVYPNGLEFVPKPSRTSRTPPSVIISLERSRSATTRLETVRLEMVSGVRIPPPPQHCWGKRGALERSPLVIRLSVG